MSSLAMVGSGRYSSEAMVVSRRPCIRNIPGAIATRVDKQTRHGKFTVGTVLFSTVTGVFKLAVSVLHTIVEGAIGVGKKIMATIGDKDKAEQRNFEASASFTRAKASIVNIPRAIVQAVPLGIGHKVLHHLDKMYDKRHMDGSETTELMQL